MSPLAWSAVEPHVSAALETRVRCRQTIGNPRPRRATWSATAEGWGELIVKARRGDFAEEQTAFTALYLPHLGARGYPTPEIVWQGPLADGWHAVVERRLAGSSLQRLDERMFARLLDLVELQADADVDAATRAAHDLGEYHAHVLFDGWDDVWSDAAALSPASAAFCARVGAFLEPAWGRRLPPTDFTHNDLHLGNVLGDGSTITGIVDWDAFAFGSRAVDLAAIAFDCARLDEPAMVEELARRIVEIAGRDGARCVVAYRGLAHLAALQRRSEPESAGGVLAAGEALLALVG